MEGGQCACASSAWQHSVQAFVKWRTKHTSTRVITEETTLMMGTATVRVALMMNVMTRSRTPSSNCNNRRGLVAPLCGHVTSYRRGRKAWPHSMSIGNFFFFFARVHSHRRLRILDLSFLLERVNAMSTRQHGIQTNGNSLTVVSTPRNIVCNLFYYWMFTIDGPSVKNLIAEFYAPKQIKSSVDHVMLTG